MFVLKRAIERGATTVRAPWEETDEFGTIKFCSVQTYGETTHTFIDRKNYKVGSGVTKMA